MHVVTSPRPAAQVQQQLLQAVKVACSSGQALAPRRLMPVPQQRTHALTLRPAAGIGQRAVQLMALRAQRRVVFGRPIAGHGAFLERLAEARIMLDSARLVVLDAAATLDAVGNKLVRPPGLPGPAFRRPTQHAARSHIQVTVPRLEPRRQGTPPNLAS